MIFYDFFNHCYITVFTWKFYSRKFENTSLENTIHFFILERHCYCYWWVWWDINFIMETAYYFKIYRTLLIIYDICFDKELLSEILRNINISGVHKNWQVHSVFAIWYVGVWWFDILCNKLMEYLQCILFYL